MGEKWNRKRDKRLGIRMTKSEKELIEERAKVHGMGLTDYLVMLSQREADEIK